MTIPADGTNHPIRPDKKRKIERKKARVKELVSEGKTEEEAEKQVRDEEFGDLR